MQSKIEVRIPVNYREEREYAVHCIFYDFLGLSYELIIDEESTGYIVSFGEKKMMIHDAFFNQYPQKLSYLKTDALPTVSFASNQFLIEKDIPILYGSNEIKIEKNICKCFIDIFASIFFMLTRWEEYVNKERDSHGRFPATASIAYKSNFLHRPVVNEYVEMLWNILKYMGYEGERKKRKFELVLTHDIDIMRWRGNIGRAMAGDLLKRGNLSKAFSRLSFFFKEPVRTYDFLMDQSEKIGMKSHFYFMATEDENLYDTPNYLNTEEFQVLIKKIRSRGHIVGFHPGYTTFLDEEKWKIEKERLEDVIGDRVIVGRQHYLRMDISQTLRIWNNQKMEVDSTLGYADQVGFRCGTGDCFQVFDFLYRKELALRERPLVVMDGSLKVYQNISLPAAEEILNYYIQIGHKYKMTITFLFHNSSFDACEWRGWKQMYKSFLYKNFRLQ